MATFTSHSPEETIRFGEGLGRAARPGWVFGLSGDLGAGKTQFVKGLALGLGIKARIASPTFALVNEHRGEHATLFHLDLYRLDNNAHIVAAGLEDYLAPRDGVSVIEWFERWTGAPPERLCRVHIRVLGETGRQIDYNYDPPRD